VVKNAVEIDHVLQVSCPKVLKIERSSDAVPCTQAGNKNRSVGATLMNQTSSRSHSIFTVIVECGSKGIDGEDHISVGRLNLVDLAGSERQSKTGATGDRLKEATKINLSLSALGNVISALVDGKTAHIPYRDSKLTRLLQDSLGGNTKTVMCANAGPADYNYDETLTTLRYANRAKNIKNKPKINEDPKDAMLREFQDEIERLKAELATDGGGGGGGGDGGMGLSMGADGKPASRKPQVKIEKEIIEKVKVVERIIVKREGVSEEELKSMESRAAAEKKALQKKAQMEVKALMANQAKTEEDRSKIHSELAKEEEERVKKEAEKSKIVEKLKGMQEKLIEGGKLMDKAAKQEIELRRANVEIEERKRQEMQLKRELDSKTEANIEMDQQYSSLQEEVDVKTKKLKKLWVKFKEAETECRDIEAEFNREKEDMLDTIRQLARQLKLKEVLISNFVPLDLSANLEKRAHWDDSIDEWRLARMKSESKKLDQRPVSQPTLRRPETGYARQRKMYDANPRYRRYYAIRDPAGAKP
jgi:kinesin family protein 3/17